MASTTDSSRSGSGLGLLFGLTYDHLGSVVLLNVIWVVMSIPWLALGAVFSEFALVLGEQLQISLVGGIGLTAAATLIVYSPPSFMLLAAMLPWLRGGDTPDRATLWRIVRGRFVAVQVLGICATLVTVLLLVNVLFYQNLGGWFGAMLSGFMLWLLAALVLVSLYWLPLLAHDTQAPLRQVLRQGLFLVFSHPLASLLLLLTLLALLGLGLVTGIGWMCGIWAVGALQLNLGVARLLHLHGGEPVVHHAASWRQLLRPWE